MKTKLNNWTYTLLIAMITLSCSASRQASAQDDGYYPPPHDRNDDYGNNRQPDYNSDDDYGNGDYNRNDDDYDDDDYGYRDDDRNYDDDRSNVNINVFVGALSPYGRWMNYGSYGQVWICNDAGFIPYQTRGHWAYTPYGWTWVSAYNWGWAPFHYGRWTYDPFYGWMWVPGYTWGPAWVCWRNGGGYYGWTPMAPGVSFNVGFSFGNGIPYNRWTFAPCRYMGNPYIGRYYAPRTRNVTIIRNTTIINNTTVYNNHRFVGGPNRVEVERFTGRKVETMKINNVSKPGETRVYKNSIQMYRPSGAVVKKNYKPVNNNGRGQNMVKANDKVKQNDRVNDNAAGGNKVIINRNDNNNNNGNKKYQPADNANNDRVKQQRMNTGDESRPVKKRDQQTVGRGKNNNAPGPQRQYRQTDEWQKRNDQRNMNDNRQQGNRFDPSQTRKKNNDNNGGGNRKRQPGKPPVK